MLYFDEIEALKPEALECLKRRVREDVVVVRHPMFGGGYDVWYRRDYARLQQQNPYMTSHFVIEDATLDNAWEYLELVDPTLWRSEDEPLFNVWPLDPLADHVIEEDS